MVQFTTPTDGSYFYKIQANDEIGIVFTNESTGKTVLKFNVFNEMKPENPNIWLDK